MRDRRSIDILASLLGLGGAALAFAAVTDFPPTIDRRFHQAVGQAIAQEALRHLKPAGTLTVLLRDTTEFPHPEADAQLRGFRQAVAAAGRDLDSVRTFQLDPLRPLAVPPGDFFELLRRTAPGSVIVSFMGPPELTAEQRNQLGQIQPGIVAFCPGNLPRRAGLRELLESGWVHAAIVDQPAAPARPKDFDAAYRIVRPADAASLDSPETNLR